MRTKAGTIVLATTLGLGGLATGIVIAPAMATAATSETTAAAAVGDRVSKIKNALKGLVTDGTLTQAQADKVATTLDQKLEKRGHGRGPGHGRGHGPKGPRLEAAATAIGITEAELRTQLKAGKTLAQIAATKNISKAVLIDKLVTAAEAHLAQAVKDGKLTQAQADERTSDLRARITESVDRAHPGRGNAGSKGPRGPEGEQAPETGPGATSSSTDSA